VEGSLRLPETLQYVRIEGLQLGFPLLDDGALRSQDGRYLLLNKKRFDRSLGNLPLHELLGSMRCRVIHHSKSTEQMVYQANNNRYRTNSYLESQHRFV